MRANQKCATVEGPLLARSQIDLASQGDVNEQCVLARPLVNGKQDVRA